MMSPTRYRPLDPASSALLPAQPIKQCHTFAHLDNLYIVPDKPLLRDKTATENCARNYAQRLL